MRELIRAENPDFIMTTGDTVYGERNLDFLEKALEPVLESGIPWGYAFGNHDVEFASSPGAVRAGDTVARLHVFPRSASGMEWAIAFWNLATGTARCSGFCTASIRAPTTPMRRSAVTAM
jgi:hypothetical protein